MALGTYKHIGRLRSARLVGREMASFYSRLGEIQKTAAFLTDALRTFEQDGWRELAAQTQVELAECHAKSGDVRKYIRACIAVCAAPEIDNLIRWTYFDELKKHLNTPEKMLIVPFKDVLKIVSVSVKNDGVVMQDACADVELCLESNFPREILCADVLISLEVDGKKGKDKVVSQLSWKDLESRDALTRKLKIQRHLDYKQDKQLSGASVVCASSPVKRADSIAAQHRSEFAQSLRSSLSVCFIFVKFLPFSYLINLGFVHFEVEILLTCVHTTIPEGLASRHVIIHTYRSHFYQHSGKLQNCEKVISFICSERKVEYFPADRFNTRIEHHSPRKENEGNRTLLLRTNSRKDRKNRTALYIAQSQINS